MESEIVERLRGWCPHEDECPRVLIDEAAEEIDRLRAELAAAIRQRDEARRDACAFDAINRWYQAHPEGIMSPFAVERISREVAVERGWDCFAQQEGGGA